MSPSQSATGRWGLGFHTVRGSIDAGNHHFRLRFVGVVEIWKYFCSGDGILSYPGAGRPRRWPEGQLSPRAGSMSPSQSATGRWGLGFLTVWGGINPGDLRFRPRAIGVVEVWKDFCSGDETLSSPGAAGSRRCPEGQLSPRAVSMSPSQLAISNRPVGLEFPHLAVQYRPGGSPFSSPGGCSRRDMEGVLIRRRDPFLPRYGGISTLSREATLAARWLHELQPISNQ